MSAHMGLLGALSEANEIAEQNECSFENALEIWGWLQEWRAQEHQDATESNVIYYDFKNRCRL